MMRNRIWISFVVMVLVYFWHPYLAGSTVSETKKNKPDLIAIGTFFNGTELTVSGEVGTANDVAVIVSGKQEELTLKKKGKVLGLLWMNLGDVHVKKVPNLYLLYTSDGQMKSAASAAKTWEKFGIGFEYIKKEMEIEAKQEKKEALANEFLKLKQSQGLYAFHPGEIIFEQQNEKIKHFTARIWIPPRIPVGEYQVKVLEIQHEQITDQSKNQLNVKEEGIPLMLSSMAFNHSLLYGFFAVLIAVAAGLAMDFFFGTGKGGGAH